jgi:hypothetical protein
METLVIVSAAITFTSFMFGFWIGRCARKLPIIDDNLPWTMHREQAPRCYGDCHHTWRDVPESPVSEATDTPQPPTNDQPWPPQGWIG